MRNASAHPRPATARRNRYWHEIDLVEGAIALVGGGGAYRVSLAIQNGPLILDEARATALLRGVVLRASRHPGRAGCDVVVEPIA